MKYLIIFAVLLAIFMQPVLLPAQNNVNLSTDTAFKNNLNQLLINTLNAKMQDKQFGIRFTGFVKSDFWYDSRQVVGSREDIFLFFPKNISLDKTGKDINSRDNFNFSAITSRLTGIITGPEAFGAKTSGVIEADFSGMSNADINGFRLRHAYSKLSWAKYEMLFGQYWHPMFVPDVFPQVISLNTGAPFHPFIRNPQVSLTRFIRNWKIQLAMVGQRDNSNDGPDSYSPSYIRNTTIPNIHLQLQYKGKTNTFGFAGDYKQILPRTISIDSFYSTETVNSYALMAYWKYAKEKTSFRFKTIYGQNLTEHLMLGGYAVHSIDTATGIETYTPTNHLFMLGNFTYGKKIMFGLFGGFAKNFGTSDTNTGKYYSRGSDIAYMYRIAPSISFKSGSTQISTEIEYTVAAYGKADKYGIIKNPKEVGNLRVLLTIFYFF
jgi:hypothetical protein